MNDIKYFSVTVMVLSIAKFGLTQKLTRPPVPYRATESCVQTYYVPKHSVQCDPSNAIIDHINEIGNNVEAQGKALNQLHKTVQELDPNQPRPLPVEVTAQLLLVDELNKKSDAQRDLLTIIDERLTSVTERMTKAEANENQQLIDLMQQQADLIQITNDQSNASLHEEYLSRLQNISSILNNKVKNLTIEIDERLRQSSNNIQDLVTSTQDVTRTFIEQLRDFLDAKINTINLLINQTEVRLAVQEARTTEHDVTLNEISHNLQAVNQTQKERTEDVLFINDQLQILEEKHVRRKEETGHLTQRSNYTEELIEMIAADQQILMQRLETCQQDSTKLNTKVEELAEQLNRQRHILPKTIKAKNCDDILKYYQPISGIYQITPRPISESFEVYCQLSDTSGQEIGWTVIQRRQNGTLDFYRAWEDYKNGFGDLDNEHWLGFNKIRSIINNRPYILRIDLLDWDGTWYYAEYQEFSLADENNFFKLHVDGYRGNAGDSLSYHDGAYFSTYDKTNDESDGMCPEICGGGWWYKNCYHSNLNGRYYEGGHYKNDVWGDGIVWRHTFGTNMYSFKAVIMKIKPDTNL